MPLYQMRVPQLSVRKCINPNPIARLSPPGITGLGTVISIVLVYLRNTKSTEMVCGTSAA